MGPSPGLYSRQASQGVFMIYQGPSLSLNCHERAALTTSTVKKTVLPI